MLANGIKVIVGNISIKSSEGYKPASEIRDEYNIFSAVGWSEVGIAKVKEVLVHFDHRGPIFTLTTSQGAVLRATPDHPCFGRLNPLLRQHYVYLMERSSLGFRVGFTSDLQKEVLSHNIGKSTCSEPFEIVDKIWIIEATENYQRAIFFEKLCSYKYGLPTIPFVSSHPSADLPDELILEIYNQIDTPSRALKLLKDWYMFENSPHITTKFVGGKSSISHAVQYIIFGSEEKVLKQSHYAHLIRIDGNIEALKSDINLFKRRIGNRGLWYLEVTRDDIEEANLFVKTLSALDGLEIVKKIQLTKKAPFYIVPASHLKVGMVVPISTSSGIEEDFIVSISVEDYTGPLYDFKVEPTANYIAGNWVVASWKDYIKSL